MPAGRKPLVEARRVHRPRVRDSAEIEAELHRLGLDRRGVQGRLRCLAALHVGGKVTQKTAMVRIFRLLCALLAGGQLFFVAIAAQVVFPRAVANLPRGEPRRVLAADLVGSMLARLDTTTLLLSALAVVLAVACGRRRTELLPLVA